MSRTVVVPLIGPQLDPEGASEQALPVARALANRAGADVVLISVIELMTELGGLPESDLVNPEVLQQYRDDRERYLDDIARSFSATQTQTAVRVGNPVDQVLEVLDYLDEPVIVMASHSRTGIRRLIMGSNASSWAQRARCPVIVVPVQPDADPNASVTINRLLVPLDGSPLAESVLGSALGVLGGASIDLHLVEVIEPGSQHEASTRRYYGVSHQMASEYLQETAERLTRDGCSVTWEVRVGEPESEIAAVAGERDVDLVAMATRGRAGIGRLLSGSVTQDVARTVPIPLLLMHPSEEAVSEYQRSVRAGRRLFQEPRHDEERGQPLQVRSIMVSPIVTVHADTSVEDVARIMLDHHIGGVPVVDDDGTLIGIVTESDFTGTEHGVPFSIYRVPQLFGQWLSREGIERIYAAGRTMTARQIMRHPVVTATEDEPVTQVVERLIQRDINRMPVVRDGAPVGIVSRHDLLKILAFGGEEPGSSGTNAREAR